MGRSRGKGKKSVEAESTEDDGAAVAGDEAAPAHRRRGRPQKAAPLDDGTDEAEGGIAMADEDGHGVKPAASSKDSKSGAAENGAGKKRRRRRRQPKQSSGSVEDEDVDGDGAKGGPAITSRPQHGFRQNGSRRKSTPRRAAEAGVECK